MKLSIFCRWLLTTCPRLDPSSYEAQHVVGSGTGLQTPCCPAWPPAAVHRTSSLSPSAPPAAVGGTVWGALPPWLYAASCDITRFLSSFFTGNLSSLFLHQWHKQQLCMKAGVSVSVSVIYFFVYHFH